MWGQLEGTEEERAYRFIGGDESERRHLEELDIDNMNFLKLIFKK